MPKLVPEDLVKATRIINKVSTPKAQQDLAIAVQNDLQLELQRNQLTTGDALEVVSAVMHSSRKEFMRLNAAKLALQLNGVLSKDNEVEQKANVVQFVFHDSDVNLNQIFSPKR